MQKPLLAGLLAYCLMGGVAEAQVSEAQNRYVALLGQARQPAVFTSGRLFELQLMPFENVRSIGRCRISYRVTYPNHPEVPESFRNLVYDGISDFTKTSGDEADTSRNRRRNGNRVDYDYTRRNGRTNANYTVLPSPAAAQAFLEAADTLISECRSDVPAQAAENQVFDPAGAAGALAIDRNQGQLYGWSIDYKTLQEAEQRAVAECQRLGGKCQVVLRFTGGCGAYVADQARGSTVYGWGTAIDRGSAESRAREEAVKRGANQPLTRVWGCNTQRAAASKARPSGTAPAPEPVNPSQAAETATANADAAKRAEEQRQRIEAEKTAYQQRLQAFEQERAAHQESLRKAAAAQADYEREQQRYRDQLKAYQDALAQTKAPK